MKKNKKMEKIIKKIVFITFLIYIAYIFINQQQTLNSYKVSQKYYEEQLNKELAYQETLNNTKSNINSKEYIEKVAREKLDMYLPNERVYIDSGN